MARGFESKQVEEQQSMAQAKSSDSQKQALTPEEKARMQQKASLELMRTKIVNDLAASTNERHRAMLELALKDVEEKLKGGF
ncbi:MAG: hypothetical protein JWN45_1237 [Acidobacteriaceae bacterium]|nr:hypothetical protein [Acidobacteriaceae bacterium]